MELLHEDILNHSSKLRGKLNILRQRISTCVIYPFQVVISSMARKISRRLLITKV